MKILFLLFVCAINANMSPLAHAVNANSNQEAADLERRYRETNDVLYYDHSCSSSSSSSSSSATAGLGDAGGCGVNGGNDPANVNQVWTYLVGQFEAKGFSEQDAQNAAAGVMGNWMQESSLNSYVSGGQGCGSSAAFGIAQWCGDRITKAKEFIASQGKSEDCLGAQIQYAWSELEGGYSSVIDNMKGKSASEAALIFDQQFEKSTDQQHGNNNRENNAANIFAVQTGAAPASTLGSSTPGAGSSSSSSSSSSCGSAATDNGECQNPFRDLKNSGVSRLDGGYDYGGPSGEGPIYAACPAKIILVRTSGSGWPGLGTSSGGAYIKYQMTAGKAKDLYMFISEDCTPKVKEGDTVDTSTPICYYKDQGTQLETGWASGGGGTGYVEWSDYNSHGGGNWASNSGVDVDQFLQSLGLPHDNVNAGPSTTGVPPGWPKWTTGGNIND